MVAWIERMVRNADGLIAALGRDEICELLRHSREDEPAAVADLLIRLAIDADGADNVIIIIADIAGSDRCVVDAPPSGGGR